MDSWWVCCSQLWLWPAVGCSLVFWIVFARTRHCLGITGFTPGWAVLVLCGLVWGHAVGFMANTVGLALPLAATVFTAFLVVCGGLVVVVGLLVICIVVASIFFVCFVGFFSFCGRLVDALVPRADEGRCGLRYSLGSWRASVDPGVSEWGNLTGFVACYHCLNV